MRGSRLCSLALARPVVKILKAPQVYDEAGYGVTYGRLHGGDIGIIGDIGTCYLPTTGSIGSALGP